MSITFENVSKTSISYREKMSLKERKEEESGKRRIYSTTA